MQWKHCVPTLLSTRRRAWRRKPRSNSWATRCCYRPISRGLMRWLPLMLIRSRKPTALSPMSGHAFLRRRCLIIPGIRSSRTYIVAAQPDPTHPKLIKTIEPEEVFRKTGYSGPRTVHCKPEGIYINTWGGGGKAGKHRPPGVFVMDCETFETRGRCEIDRGPKKLHDDFWWNLPRDSMVSSEWGLPPQFENGIAAEDLLAYKYGHSVHFWNLRDRKLMQAIDLGANHQMALEIRPAHDPTREYGFLGVVVDTTNFEGSIWTWYRENGKFHIKKPRRFRLSRPTRSCCRRC